MGGSVVQNPIKVLESDPRDDLSNGAAGVYPITAVQLVGDPMRGPSGVRIVDECLRRSNRFEVVAVESDAQTEFELHLRASPDPADLALPNRLLFGVVGRSFVPRRLERTLQPQVREVIELSGYREYGECVVPGSFESRTEILDSKGIWHQVSGTKNQYEFDRVGNSIPPGELQFKFPDGAAIFFEAEGAKRVIGRSSPFDWRLALKLAATLIGTVGVLLLLRGWRLRSTSSESDQHPKAK